MICCEERSDEFNCLLFVKLTLFINNRYAEFLTQSAIVNLKNLIASSEEKRVDTIKIMKGSLELSMNASEAQVSELAKRGEGI